MAQLLQYVLERDGSVGVIALEVSRRSGLITCSAAGGRGGGGFKMPSCLRLTYGLLWQSVAMGSYVSLRPSPRPPRPPRPPSRVARRW